MAHQVIWTKRTLDFFIANSGMNDFQIQLMIDRCKNMTVVEMSFAYNCSESKIHKEIAKIKKIYDEVQSQHPNDLPPRKASSKELYMDTH